MRSIVLQPTEPVEPSTVMRLGAVASFAAACCIAASAPLSDSLPLLDHAAPCQTALSTAQTLTPHPPPADARARRYPEGGPDASPIGLLTVRLRRIKGARPGDCSTGFGMQPRGGLRRLSLAAASA